MKNLKKNPMLFCFNHVHFCPISSIDIGHGTNCHDFFKNFSPFPDPICKKANITRTKFRLQVLECLRHAPEIYVISGGTNW